MSIYSSNHKTAAEIHAEMLIAEHEKTKKKKEGHPIERLPPLKPLTVVVLIAALAIFPVYVARRLGADVFLVCGPVAIYFIAKLFRYLTIILEDRGHSGFVLIIVSFFHVFFSLLVLPIAIIGFFIDGLFLKLEKNYRSKVCRNIRTAYVFKEKPEELRNCLGIDPREDWNHEEWLEDQFEKVIIE